MSKLRYAKSRNDLSRQIKVWSGPLIPLHFGVSWIESWRCQRILTTGIPKSRYAKLRFNRAVRSRCDLDRWSDSISEFRGSKLWSDKNTEHQECRNREMRNHEMIWAVRSSVDRDRWSHAISGFRGSRLGESRCLISRFTKCEIVKVLYA
jgi:hypothetical protein